MPKLTMQTITPWARETVRHWKRYLPKMAAELEAVGKLELEAQLAVDKTKEEMELLTNRGMSWDQALEMTQGEYMYLPPEDDLPEEDEDLPVRESWEIMKEAVQSYNRIMNGEILFPEADAELEEEERQEAARLEAEQQQAMPMRQPAMHQGQAALDLG